MVEHHKPTDPWESIPNEFRGQVIKKGCVYKFWFNKWISIFGNCRDSYNTASNEEIVTIPITDDTPASVSDNWSGVYYRIRC